MAEMDKKLSSLRRLMESQSGGALQAYIIPSEDAHQSEYVAAGDQRRAFITGFTGSAGLAGVTSTEALMWTDGRYFLQAEQQFMGTEWKLMRTGEDPPMERWMADNLPPKSRIGFDPSCVSIDTFNIWHRALQKAGHDLVAVSQNLVDVLWTSRPAPKVTKVAEHPIEFTGKSTKDKLKELRQELGTKGAFAIVITALDEVAWLYNIRGSDVEYCPVVHAYAVVTLEHAFLYVDGSKVDNKVQDYLQANGVQICDYTAILDDVRKISVAILSLRARGGLLTASKLTVSGRGTGGKEDVFVDSKIGIESHESKEISGRSVSFMNEERESRHSENAKDVGETLDLPTQENRPALIKDEGADTSPSASVTTSRAVTASAGQFGSVGDMASSEDVTVGASESERDEEFVGAESALGETEEEKLKLWLDPASCNYGIMCAADLPTERVLQQASPISLSKAVKEHAELDGMRNSHIRDAVALVRFCAWLDEQMQVREGVGGYFSEMANNVATTGERGDPDELTEVTVADKLEGFRSEQKHFVSLSFPTISSVGANAAIIHYCPDSATCASLNGEEIYLCDSGAQYLDGTTDVTRTVHFGKPTPHQKRCFTQVLRGHIALQKAIFPKGTTGHTLDVLARVPLWQSGLDYRHGTGHGVGAYLNVHEGPQLISFRSPPRNVPLIANMVVTNEPGYYEDGGFGIRIENVMIVKDVVCDHNFGNKGFLGFEPITWVPIQTKMIDLSLMSESEMEWVNEYHAECFSKLEKLVPKEVQDWLRQATQPLQRPTCK